MTRYVLVFLVAAMSVVNFVYAMKGFRPPEVRERPLPTVHHDNVPTVTLRHPLIEEVNARNAAVRSFRAQIRVRTWDGGMRFRLNGSLDYEKDRRFRMELGSLFGEELDLGSNDDVFWYWSKRDKKPGVWYARHEDFHQTRLKTPFDPMFMRSSLGFEPIPTENAEIRETDDEVLVTQKRANSVGDPILYTVCLDKATKTVGGVVVTNLSGETLAACEVASRAGSLPSKILCRWHEEDRSMEMELEDGTANVSISSDRWTMPDHDRKINMAEE